MSPPSPPPPTPGAPPRSNGTGAPTPCRSPNGSASGTDRFAAEPCASFWSATTSPELEAATTAVMAFRWSPPISNPPPKIWSPAMPHGGESSSLRRRPPDHRSRPDPQSDTSRRGTNGAFRVDLLQRGHRLVHAARTRPPGRDRSPDPGPVVHHEDRAVL